MTSVDFPNIRHLQVFCEVIATGSVSAAADRLHMTQPAASQGIAKLEHNLGASLLLRQSNGIAATDVGAVFERRARRSIALLQQAVSALQKTGGGHSALHRITAAQLRALIAVGDTGSFTIAAAAIGIAQPTVHRSARALETATGVVLFRNAVTGIEMTALGQMLYHQAKLARQRQRP